MFQSRAGFSVRRDQTSEPPAVSRAARFNLVLGFLAVATRRSTKTERPTSRFNPVLGFLAVATRSRRESSARWHQVSIPYWVFWPSRRSPSRNSSPNPSCFNPVLGFLAVATRRPPRRSQRCQVSIPYWVFWPSRLAAISSITPGVLTVSIPYWVFWPSRHDSLAGAHLVDAFQSRTGFSGRRDVPSFRARDPDGEFQSRTGFSGRRDERIFVKHEPQLHVSIPYWVFWPSRPPTMTGRCSP